ncbi:hypothetical protein E1286_33290 [Nonomuraea terrae]|uniref:Uncharacterized protein n=1 Tax=Nonomuraea terrae TaxID=2530383 RepID=A0A4R4Y9H3_9ACTN|nr:hypothetical protein [Nonomuraea terrae]TDD41125.1 hypothetical protein E1286_33290 [Nonomuraea terrae]
MSHMVVSDHLDPEDALRLDRLTRRSATWEMVARGPGVTGSVLAALTRHCRVDHAASMLLPHRFAGLRTALKRGFEVVRTCPSTVVRRRLADRHGLDPPVLIAHAAGAGPEQEVFVPAREECPGVERAGYNPYEDDGGRTVLCLSRPADRPGRLELVADG